MKYRKIEGSVLPEGAVRDVIFYSNGDSQCAIEFRCPCGLKRIYATSPPHRIMFNQKGLLTLGGACGILVNKTKSSPGDWCHFTITKGHVAMMPDAKCPGKQR